MKNQLLIFSTLMLWAGSLFGVNVQIGSGTDTTEQFPIISYYGYNYSQQIYLGSEIAADGGTVGNITKIRFYYCTGSGSSSTWNNWNVYLGNTSKTGFTSSYDWIPADSMSQVFSGMIPDAVDGTWLEITLPAPYYYSGGNIVVAVDENSDGWNDPWAHWGSYNSGSNRGLSFFDDATNPDPAAPPNANMGPENKIAQIQFEMTDLLAVNVHIGSGTDTNEYFPLYSCYGYNYSQQIYLGSEIAAGGGSVGTINKIRFFYSSGATNFTTWNDWTVYLGNTTKSEFANSTDWISATSLTQVFSGLIPDPVAGTWFEITLPVPFHYTGGNIVVAVDENSDSWDCTTQWRSFYTGTPRGLLYYNDDFNPDPLSPPDANVGPDNTIAQVQFEITNPLDVNVQIGSGTDTTEMLPVYSWYGYSYSQQIYLGSEITAGGGGIGPINKLRFLYSSGGTNFPNWNNWTVYLGNTTKTDFTGSSDWVPVTSMTQVFSGIIPDPVDGTWLEIALPTSFVYTGGNIVVAVDENSDGYDWPSAQWHSFNSGSPRGMLFFDDNNNPDPASPPDANYGPDNNLAQVQFVMPNGYGILEGYITEEPDCITPVSGATVSSSIYTTNSDTAGFYHLVLPVGTYDITANNHDINQTISPVEISVGNTTTVDFCLPPYFPPPVSLQAEISGPELNNVHLSWQAPGSTPDQWIHWDDGYNNGALGYGAPTVFSVASRWPVSDIGPYDGTYLKKIRFFPTEATTTYTLKVWKGADAATLLHSQVVDDPITNAWNEVTLTAPILVDGTEEFWFGYEANQTIGLPVGLAAGPAITGKGDMINAGYGWFSMKQAWGWEFNWCLQGFVSENPSMASQLIKPLARILPQQPSIKSSVSAQEKPIVHLYEQTTSDNPTPSIETNNQVWQHPSVKSPFAPTISLTGYNVYRDNNKIVDNITNLFYDDLSLPKGGYDYEVTAQYDNGESVRIGPVHVDIYTCFPPTNLMVSNATLTTTTADLSWTPSTLSTATEWELEWGLQGFTQGLGTLVNVSSAPGYSLFDLTPGTTYDFYVRTVCSTADASAWVKKAFRTHYFDCPVNAIDEAEACGDTTNNGCSLVIPTVENINCGDTICGTSWLSRSHRDTDWYSLALADTADITFSANAEFNYYTGITAYPCLTSPLITNMTNSAGNSYPLNIRLNTGTYFIFMTPSFGEQVTCDSLNRYWTTLSCNTCLKPTALGAVNITQTSADLVWTSSASSWNIEWGPAGFARGTGAGTLISGVSSKPYNLAGLTTGYSYSYYVQGDCGDGQSSWAGPYIFFMPCTGTSLPFAEDFTTKTVDFTPQCWQVKGDGLPSNWVVDNSSNYAGGTSPQLKFVSYNVYFTGNLYMMSPVINTTGQTELTLSFKQFISLYYVSPACQVLTTSDGGITWDSVWSIDQSLGIGPETRNLTIANADVGSANFQFAFVVKGSSWNVSNWLIDDIVLSASKKLDLKVYLEGLFDAGTGLMKQAMAGTVQEFGADTADQLTVELRNYTAPYDLATSPFSVNLRTDGTAVVNLPEGISSEYYIVVKHRNSIETWSSIPVSFAGGTISYDFSTTADAALDGNLKQQGSVFMLFGGDANQDGTVDALDMDLVKTQASGFGSGYIPEDINGDGIVDAQDLIVTDNNAANFVVARRP